jgi:hypothetical protein
MGDCAKRHGDDPQAGRRGAVLYTLRGEKPGGGWEYAYEAPLIEYAKRHGHGHEVWLADVLERLPAMTNRDDRGAMLPSRWQPAAASAARTAEACPA